jgi:hypothetical protein
VTRAVERKKPGKAVCERHTPRFICEIDTKLRDRAAEAFERAKKADVFARWTRERNERESESIGEKESSISPAFLCDPGPPACGRE